MTEADLEELITDCPTLYHMAERGSWESIKRYGLLSTSALLDHYAVEPPKRTEIESRHRPTDWYELLNAKVFFWLSEAHLHKLTNAKAYRAGARYS